MVVRFVGILDVIYRRLDCGQWTVEWLEKGLLRRF